MIHPEGRVIAVQQQMFFAGLLAEKMDMDTTVILRKLGMAGLMLVADANEVAVDSAAIYPRLQDERPKLQAVKEQS